MRQDLWIVPGDEHNAVRKVRWRRKPRKHLVVQHNHAALVEARHVLDGDRPVSVIAQKLFQPLGEQGVGQNKLDRLHLLPSLPNPECNQATNLKYGYFTQDMINIF